MLKNILLMTGKTVMEYSQEGVRITRVETVNLAHFNFCENYFRIFQMVLSLWLNMGRRFPAFLGEPVSHY